MEKPKNEGFLKNSLVLIIALGLFASGGIALWAATLDIPDLDTFEDRKVVQSTKIYDRTGEILLYDLHGDVKRTMVPYEDISRHIKNASVAIEDTAFYEHIGIQPSAILRAVFVNLVSLGYEQGGSTITQQVVKNSLLTQDKTITRKLKEWVLALKLEREVDKDRILELYLNEVPYGGNLYGIEEASRSYFGKQATDLSITEAAYLAALPQAPSFYLNNPEELEERKNLVLTRMAELGFISEDERDEAQEKELHLAPPTSQSIQAPHFVFYVISQLEDRYGKEFIETNGLRVRTTIDLPLQKNAEEVVARFAPINEERFNAKNAGIVATDPATGQILAMVGSRDYFNTEDEGNFNVTIQPNRQPGSSFKPFVYATALAKGYTPETTIFDLRTQFHTGCDWEGNPTAFGVTEDDCYQPVNYSGNYHGPVTFREALAQSINVPAIKVLYLSGLRDSLETAERMGISSLANPNQYGLTLVLGGGEVSLLEMTNAYGVFANDGLYNPSTPILSVETSSGETLDEFTARERRALDEQVARQITDILSDNEARAPAFGYNSPLYFPGYDVAAKTGTTNDYKDMWIIGYTPNLAVGAWAGNNDFTSMSKEVAGFVIAPMWHAFLAQALPTRERELFKEPAPIADYEDLKPILRGKWRGGESYFIDSVSGKRATESTPDETKEERIITDVHSILYWLDKDNPRGPKPANPSRDPQFELWEKPVRKWVEEEGIVEGAESAPQASDDIHTPDRAPSIALSGLPNGARIAANEQVALSLSYDGFYPFKQAHIYVGDQIVGTMEGSAGSYRFNPNEVGADKGEHTLRIAVYDSVMNKVEKTISFVVSGE